MRERAAQMVTLVRAFEEADRDGLLLRFGDREEATEHARARSGTPERLAEARAALLGQRLDEEVPTLGRVRRATRIPLAAAGPVFVVGVAAGVASDALGARSHVNILAAPLLVLLGWNLLAYLGLLVWGLRPSSANRVGLLGRIWNRPRREGRPWAGLWGALFSWGAERAMQLPRLRDPRPAQAIGRGLRLYWTRWATLSADLMAARLRLFSHVGAFALVTGAVAGMYMRGLAFEYRAVWESTFLSPEAVAALLSLALGPAAALLGEALPTAAELESMRAGVGSQPAATWIHLWAVTAALWVGVPRLALAAFQLQRQARLERDVPIEPLAGTFRVLLPEDRGAGDSVAVVPYSLELEPRQRDTLLELIHDVFGLRARVDVHESVAYGHDTPDLPAEAREARHILVVYPSVQSPEQEVHGRFAEELKPTDEDRRLLVLIETSHWRAHFGADPEDERGAQRRRAWDRVMKGAGIEPLHIDLGAPLDEATTTAAERALWAAGPDSTVNATNG